LIIKHIKRIGLNYSKIAILLLFVSCGNDTKQTESTDRLNEINKLRSKETKCNNLVYPKEHNLSKIDDCLKDIYAYTSSIQVDSEDILKSLDNDLDCTYVLGHYVQYVSFDNDLINTCGNPQLDQ